MSTERDRAENSRLRGDETADPARWIAAIAANGDRRAFAALFQFYAPRIKTLLIRAGAGAELADDIAQEALLTIWRKAAQFDPQRASASAWIYAIARNLRIDKLRQDKRAALFGLYTSSETEEPERPDDLLESRQSAQRVRAAFGALPPEQMQVIELSFVEGRAHADIAMQLNLPLGTVKSRLRLAMTRLRQLLGEVP
jgi:RNA polymerase sigma-70 factor (ECF subfamily)